MKLSVSRVLFESMFEEEGEAAEMMYAVSGQRNTNVFKCFAPE